MQDGTATTTSFTIWDRKAEGGFPGTQKLLGTVFISSYALHACLHFAYQHLETRILKQRIRDIISPEMNLGHSDKPTNPHAQD